MKLYNKNKPISPCDGADEIYNYTAKIQRYANEKKLEQYQHNKKHVTLPGYIEDENKLEIEYKPFIIRAQEKMILPIEGILKAIDYKFDDLTIFIKPSLFEKIRNIYKM